MTIPNTLTLARIVLIPVLVWFLLNGKMNAALTVFFVAGITDGLDGLIARVFNQKSRLGAFLDPLADKLLLVTSFMVLGHMSLVPRWLVIIVVSRDIMIALGFAILKLLGITVRIKPVISSKMTTLMQLVTVLLVIGASVIQLPPWAYVWLFAVTAAFSVMSGLQYIFIGMRACESQVQPRGCMGVRK